MMSDPRDSDLMRPDVALRLQLDFGADEAIGDAPVDRYAASAKPPEPARPKAAPGVAPAPPEPVAPAQATPVAAVSVDACATLEQLEQALRAFDHPLKAGARNTVFADGNPAAPLMIIGEAPGRDEDREGKPFVGRSGMLLDRMLAAIGIDRHSEDPENAVYITNVVPWRPMANRNPSADEINAMMPFVLRHIALVQPKVLVFAGNIAAKALLQTSEGITRIRGNWRQYEGIDAMPFLHPAYLLRNPIEKRKSWRDLQMIRQKLDELS